MHRTFKNPALRTPLLLELLLEVQAAPVSGCHAMSWRRKRCRCSSFKLHLQLTSALCLCDARAAAAGAGEAGELLEEVVAALDEVRAAEHDLHPA